jgi:membrane-associated phospholipid phosphatase
VLSVNERGIGSQASCSERSDWLSRSWEEAQRLDLAVYSAIAGTPSPSLDRALRRLSKAADYSRLSMTSAAILATTRGRAGREAATRGLASVAVTSAILNLGFKPLVHRRRPDRIAEAVPLVRQVRMPSSTSFPSGHAAAAFAFATGAGHVMPLSGLPLRALGALVAYSRVHTGVHYPSDVLAGALLGVALAQITTHALEQHRRTALAGHGRPKTNTGSPDDSHR